MNLEVMTDYQQITLLLGRAVGGDQDALNSLFPLVYNGLRSIAQNQLRMERKDHTLNATALVHEAYLKLVNQQEVTWQNRVHFFAVAATAMRRILVDYARARQAGKRGGKDVVITLNEEIMSGETRAGQLLELDDALHRLQALHERQSRVVELRFFAGLKEDEIAESLNISVATVKRDWRLARAWLAREMGAPATGSD
jgi:RNA polymerase sigma factor (TIGR02999 family)